MEGSIDEEYQNSVSQTFNLADQKFDAEGLMLMLDSLPDISRKVFSLFAIDGYPHKEIAQIMNISEGTSKWHVSHARMKIERNADRKKKR